MKSLFHIDLYIVACAGIDVAKLQCFLQDELSEHLFCDFLAVSGRVVGMKGVKTCQFEDLKVSYFANEI